MTSLRRLMRQVDATNANLGIGLGQPGSVRAVRMIPGGWRIQQLDGNYEMQFVSDYLTREEAEGFLASLQPAIYTPSYTPSYTDNYSDDGEPPDWEEVILPGRGEGSRAGNVTDGGFENSLPTKTHTKRTTS